LEPKSREVSCLQSFLLIRRTDITTQPSKPSTPTRAAPTDDEKRAERLAKLEAWKQKQAAEKERKQKEAVAAGGPRNILEEIDRKSGLSPAVSSPQSPATQGVDTAPAPYAGKFDPKAIVKNAAQAPAAPSVLGNDVAVPPSATPPAGQLTAKVATNEISSNGTTSSGMILPPLLIYYWVLIIYF
jgi:ATP-dependent RNA helicase DDX46/PRP5